MFQYSNVKYLIKYFFGIEAQGEVRVLEEEGVEVAITNIIVFTLD